MVQYIVLYTCIHKVLAGNLLKLKALNQILFEFTSSGVDELP